MALRVSCMCGKTYTVPEEVAGRRAKCPACGAVIRLPNPTIPPSALPDMPPSALAGTKRKVVKADAPAPAADRPRQVKLVMRRFTKRVDYFIGSPLRRAVSGAAIVALAGVWAALIFLGRHPETHDMPPRTVGAQETDAGRSTTGAEADEAWDALANEPTWTTEGGLAMAAPYDAVSGLGGEDEMRRDPPLEVEWKAIRRLVSGGSRFGTSGLGGRVVSVTLGGASVTDDDLSQLKIFRHLKRIDLSGVDADSITDRGLQHIAELQGIEWLSLAGLKVSEHAARYVANLKSLRYLDVAGTRFNDEAVRIISTLKGLEHLDLRNTRLTKASVPYLAKLSNLTLLDFSGTEINAAAAFPKLSTLKKLDDPLYSLRIRGRLGGAPQYWEARQYSPVSLIHGEWLKRSYEEPHESQFAEQSERIPGQHLVKMRGMKPVQQLDLSLFTCGDEDLVALGLEAFRELELLDLSDQNFTARCLVHLPTLPNLKYLNISGTHIGDIAIEELRRFPRLTDVVVFHSHISERGAREWQRELPRLLVSWSRCRSGPAGRAQHCIYCQAAANYEETLRREADKIVMARNYKPRIVTQEDGAAQDEAFSKREKLIANGEFQEVEVLEFTKNAPRGSLMEAHKDFLLKRRKLRGEPPLADPVEEWRRAH